MVCFNLHREKMLSIHFEQRFHTICRWNGTCYIDIAVVAGTIFCFFNQISGSFWTNHTKAKELIFPCLLLIYDMANILNEISPMFQCLVNHTYSMFIQCAIAQGLKERIIVIIIENPCKYFSMCIVWRRTQFALVISIIGCLQITCSTCLY